jgi:hypothetical protein
MMPFLAAWLFSVISAIFMSGSFAAFQTSYSFR